MNELAIKIARAASHAASFSGKNRDCGCECMGPATLSGKVAIAIVREMSEPVFFRTNTRFGFGGHHRSQVPFGQNRSWHRYSIVGTGALLEKKYSL